LDPHGREELARDGFLGFSTVKSLRLTRCAGVPDQQGVYLVLRSGFVAPRFLERGSGGLFKGKDPNVAISVLQLAWVATAMILYVGKAGGGKLKAHLKKRIGLLIQFGSGANVAHWGGRYLWQLADAEDLILCWKPTPRSDPRSLEKAIISEFEATYGRRPYANLVR
jgi:hypothetical protein